LDVQFSLPVPGSFAALASLAALPALHPGKTVAPAALIPASLKKFLRLFFIATKLLH
jgi:hypothetical protein